MCYEAVCLYEVIKGLWCKSKQILPKKSWSIFSFQTDPHCTYFNLYFSISLFSGRGMQIMKLYILEILGLVPGSSCSHLPSKWSTRSQITNFEQKVEVLSERHPRYLLCEIQFLYKPKVVLFSFGNDHAHVQRWNFFPLFCQKKDFRRGKNTESYSFSHAGMNRRVYGKNVYFNPYLRKDKTFCMRIWWNALGYLVESMGWYYSFKDISNSMRLRLKYHINYHISKEIISNIF